MDWEQFRIGGDGNQVDVPTEGEATFAKSTKRAPFAAGILYRGSYENYADGVCAAVRKHSTALSNTGIPVHLQSIDRTVVVNGIVEQAYYAKLHPEVQEEVKDITEVQFEKTLLVIHHLVPTPKNLREALFPRMMAAVDPDAVCGYQASSVIYAAFEGDRIDRQTVGLLNMASEIWVPCLQNKKILEDCNVRKPVVWIPHPHNDDGIVGSKKAHGGPFRFLHVGKWEPRKAQHEAIGSFLNEFSPSDDCVFILKTSQCSNWKDYPIDAEDSLRYWCNDTTVRERWTPEEIVRKVLLMPSKMMPRADLIRLFSECDCYLSTGRAEGFDLPAFDAWLAGLGIIGAGMGGAEDFVGEGCWHLNSERVSKCHPSYWYLSHANWSDYSPSELGAAMRVAFDARGSWKTFHRDVSHYSRENVGKKMRSRVDEICSNLGY